MKVSDLDACFGTCPLDTDHDYVGEAYATDGFMNLKKPFIKSRLQELTYPYGLFVRLIA